MKLYKNQSGVAHLAAILIVVLVAIIGLTGWKVYDSQKKTNQSLNNAANNIETIAKQQRAAKVPEGFVEYENKEPGFKFAYPKKWESVHLTGYDGDKTFTVKKDTEVAVDEGCEGCTVKYDPQDKKWYGYYPDNKKHQATDDEVIVIEKTNGVTAYLLPRKGALNCGVYAVLFQYGQVFVETNLSLCQKPASENDVKPGPNDLDYDSTVTDIKKLLTTFIT